jgi:hypothetical protein
MRLYKNMSETDDRLIMCFSSNTDFQIEVEELILHWGYRVMFIESADIGYYCGHISNKRQYAEPIYGAAGILVEEITRLRPILILFDIDSDGISWERWISMLSALPATRRIPIICIGKKTSEERLRRSEQLGAIESVTDKELDTNLLAIIAKYARVISEKDYFVACFQHLSEDALAGLEAFNRGRYYEAHEYLERAWMADDTIGKDLYRAILQVSVAYYQITRGNYRGAVKMFWRVRQWIDPLPETCRGINVLRLRMDLSRIYDEIIRLGSQRFHEFDIDLLQPIEHQA